MSIATTALIHPNVHLGANCTVEDFVILGAIPRDHHDGELPTIIGDNAVIRSHSVIYAGNTIGTNFQCGNHVFIRELNSIGNHVSIGTATVIEHHVAIGDTCRIHSQVFIPEYSILEAGCWLGPNVVLTNAKHPTCPMAKKCLKGATIRTAAIIGANSTLLPDIEIGCQSLIGCGSVVISDIPAGAVAVGNPAKVVKQTKDLKCPYEFIDRPYRE